MRFYLALFFCLFASVAQAEPKTVIKLFDLTAQFQTPPWAGETLDTALESQVSRQQVRTDYGTQLFLFEFIPKDQSFDAWTELYAISAETPVDAPAERFREIQISIYQNACQAPKFQLLQTDASQVMLLALCDSYSDNPDQGEIAVLSFVKRRQTLVKHYYHKRGPAFAPDNPETWPLSISQIRDHAKRLNALILIPE